MLYVARLALGITLAANLAFTVGCADQGYSTASIPTAAGQLSSITSAYPGVVMVLLPGGQGLCSGSIVSPHAVLTATHCLLHEGTYTVRSNYGEFTTSHVVRSGDGSVGDVNDIGLLIFDDFAITSLNSEIYPIANRVSVGEGVTIVGFGCTSVRTKSGAGVKREGTNNISSVGNYLVLLTPMAANIGNAIIGDVNQSGTCFGDSGGPLFVSNNGNLEIAGVTHAGGTYSNYYVSEFTDVASNSDNRAFLSQASSRYSLSIDL